MVEIPVTELHESTAAAVARAAGGETVTITEKGLAVARLTAMPATRLQELVD